MKASSTETPIAYYAAAASAFAARYDAARFDDVHRVLLDYLPPRGAAVLDIGSGSGRDALALARLGYRVVAAEPTAAFRRHAAQADAHRQVEWIDDRLPGLSGLRTRSERFAFILCSAVLMHIPPYDLADSISSMKTLLAPGGFLALSFRPPLAEEPEDVFFVHDPARVAAVARGAGLVGISDAEVDDSLGRDAVRWRTMVFQRPFGGQR